MAHQLISLVEVSKESLTKRSFQYPNLRNEYTYQISSSPVKAFHLRFEEHRLDPNIQKWDVHILQVMGLMCVVHVLMSMSLCPDQSDQETSGQAINYEILGNIGQVYKIPCGACPHSKLHINAWNRAWEEFTL